MTNPGQLNVRALKAIVIGLGILIVLALVMLAYGFYKKSSDPNWKPFGNTTTERAAETTGPSSMGFDDITLNLAAGCRIMDVTPEDNLAYLRIGPDSACEAIIVINIDKGSVIGRIAPR